MLSPIVIREQKKTKITTTTLSKNRFCANPICNPRSERSLLCFPEPPGGCPEPPGASRRLRGASRRLPGASRRLPGVAPDAMFSQSGRHPECARPYIFTIGAPPRVRQVLCFHNRVVAPGAPGLIFSQSGRTGCARCYVFTIGAPPRVAKLTP